MDVLIGREDERALLERLVTQRKNILIYGEKGVGKTTILRNLINRGQLGSAIVHEDYDR